MTPAERTAAMLRARKAVGLTSRRRRVPRQIWPSGIVREYALRLLAQQARAQALLGPLLAALPGLLARAASERQDAGEGKTVRELLDAAAATMRATMAPEQLEDLAGEFATKTATHQRIQLERQTKAALGADVFLSDRKLPAITEGFVAENVALIKSLPAQMYVDVEKAVSRALANATPHHKLAEELEERFKVSRDRARLIARDQIGKLYGQINAARQRDMGVTRFIWRTVHDQRVRAEHEDRDGKTYEYSDPPTNDRTGEPELPGEPINCRCHAEPVFADILEGL